jgi:hypothetical protein
MRGEGKREGEREKERKREREESEACKDEMKEQNVSICLGSRTSLLHPYRPGLAVSPHGSI